MEREGQLLSFSQTWRPECEESVAKLTPNNSSSVKWWLRGVGVVLATIAHLYVLWLCCPKGKKKNKKKGQRKLEKNQMD